MENKEKRPNVLIGMPVMENIHFKVVNSILENVGSNVRLGMQSGSLVYGARQKLVETFLSMKEFDYLFFWDSDMVLPPQTINKLLEKNLDVVSVVYYMKQDPYSPIFFMEKAKGNSGRMEFKYVRDNKYLEVHSEEEVPPLAKAIMVGLGGCLIKREVLEKVSLAQKDMFYPQFGYGEDATFCEHVLAEGYEIWVDPSIRVGHIGWHEYDYRDFVEFGKQYGEIIAENDRKLDEERATRDIKF